MQWINSAVVGRWSVARESMLESPRLFALYREAAEFSGFEIENTQSASVGWCQFGGIVGYGLGDATLGDRMKEYEAQFCDARLDPHLPIVARIDGRSFSSFTRDMEKPYDEALSSAMNEVCAALVEKSHARIGYVQSDEISLAFLADRPESSVFFDGRVQKLTSVLASLAASIMTRTMVRYSSRLPHFDCRVMQVPTKAEAANCFLWRWNDAVKNAISGLACKHFSPKQLHGVHGGEMLAMLAAKGVDFNAMPLAYRVGTFWRRGTIERELTADELQRIPEKFRPTGPVRRSETQSFHIEHFYHVGNREAVLFDGVEPEGK